MSSIRIEVAVLVSLITFILFYRGKSDDSDNILLRETDVLIKSDEWRLNEDKLFSASGICANENLSFVKTCKNREIGDVNNCLRNCVLEDLRHAECFCDNVCHLYHDCCIDNVLKNDIFNRKWSCREVTGITGSRFPIYVLQTCPGEWKDDYTRSMCENEASDLQMRDKEFNYMQDIPVKSETNGLFYRNIFCALCNGESFLVKWKFYYHCAGVSLIKYKQDDIDFSKSFYNTRTMVFKNVEIDGKFTNCRIIVEDFDVTSILYVHGARLCKPVINTCGAESDEISRQICDSYTSFVYKNGLPSHIRKVYKNFHCALCNKENVTKLMCIDPLLVPRQLDKVPASSLSFLFDFNFYGGDNQVGLIIPCKLEDGQIWDPVLKECSNFTCGTLFERKDSLCVPRVTETQVGGLNNSCRKRILSEDMFHVTENGSVFVNDTRLILSSNEYEVNELDGSNVISIAVCADEGSFLLHLSKVQYYLSEITLSLSIICLILHLFVYGVLKELRNCPGKILMSLSACLLCGHIFLLLGPHMKHSYQMCYTCGVLIHFGYLSSFMWMNIMAFDIYRTFSATQQRNAINKKTFVKYSLYCWSTSFLITAGSLIFDNAAPEENKFRPKYGDPICWFNQRKGLFIFFIIPVFILLLKNVTFFTIAAFKIRKISQQTKMVNNLPDKARYVLYIKLSVVFGLTWLLGFLAGMLNIGVLWYPFIIFNGLQGVFIFIAFTVKRRIIKMLLIKFRVHSESYKMGKMSGVKRTMYSSLSNLSTLQTTLAVHLPALNDNPQILKAVRKVNPDLM